MVNVNEVSLTDPNTKGRVRTLFLNSNGERSFQDISDELGIPRGTWDNYYYLNKYGVRDLVIDCKKELAVLKAEAVSNKIMDMMTEEISDKKLAIQQKESEFLRETIGKDIYSKRVETIGLNVLKTEPLDKEQQAKLDKMLGSKGKEVVDVTPEEPIVDVEYIEPINDLNNPIDIPLDSTIENNPNL